MDVVSRETNDGAGCLDILGNCGEFLSRSLSLAVSMTLVAAGGRANSAS